MVRSGEAFRTAAGEVSVDGDAVRISKAPGAHLRSQVVRWRRGERRERVGAALRFGLIPIALSLSLLRLLGTWDAAASGMVAFVVTMTGLELASLYRRYTRGTEIPLSDVSTVTLDADERELTVTFDAGSLLRPPDGAGIKTYRSDGPMSAFETGETEWTMTLPTDDDVRDARSAFRLAGVSVDEDTGASEAKRYDGETETETEYRMTTRNGVVFCEECGSQVSPSDRVCPSCDYTLRVERPVEDDERETVLEY